jgi:toxin ParE1/3/4
MKSKPIIPRTLAEQDVDEALNYYISEEAEQAALGFVDALEQAYTHLSRHPGTGSPRYAHELNLSGLRSWPLKHYPHIVFYVERPDHIDVWRVLHGQRDIPEWFRADAMEELVADVSAGKASGQAKSADAVFDRLEAKYVTKIGH